MLYGKLELMACPNIVLLTLECWRADHFGPSMPNLARLGAESAVFSQAASSGGWTLVSMTALMSSAYASMYGGCGVALATPHRYTLAESLLENGYWTAGFTANPICGSTQGFHRGFGEFLDERRIPLALSGELTGRAPDWQRLLKEGFSPQDTYAWRDAAHMTDRGLGWIERRKRDEPYFLWLHYMDSHWPYLSAERTEDAGELRLLWEDQNVYKDRVLPSRGRYDVGEGMAARWKQRYRNSLTSADQEIGRLLNELRSRPDWNNTIIVVTGDHGEELYEHGTWQHRWNQLHQEGIHVPLILRIPGMAPVSLAEPVSHLDIAPTLLDYAGAIPAGNRRRPMIGRSLRPVMEDGSLPSKAIYTEMFAQPTGSSYLLSIREGEWKYIYDFDDPHNSVLYHLGEDPGEIHNVRDWQGTTFRRFEQMRLEHVSQGLLRLLGRQSPDRPVEMNDAVRGQMIALGYLSPE